MKAGRLVSLGIALSLLATLSVAAGAAPLAGPCAPGAVYDSACDVNHDGHITVTDIQLAAGHWNQTGVWVSDNDHNHLGQNWVGSNNPLKLTGSYGTNPDNAALVLSNSAAGGNGLEVDSASTAVRVNSASSYGALVNSAGLVGFYVTDAGYDGVFVHRAGSPSSWPTSALRNGFEVAGAQGDGLHVGRADNNGVDVSSAGNNGVYVGTAINGVTVDSVSQYGVNVASAEIGVRVTSADFAGMEVGSALYGLIVVSAGTTGVAVSSATYDGVSVVSAGNNGVTVDSASNNGILVGSAGNWAGRFVGNIYVDGSCNGCLQAHFAVNAGDRPLQPGDVVSIESITVTDLDTAPDLWQVVHAQPGRNVVGVVAGRAELYTDESHAPDQTGQGLAPREGPAQAGEYVTVVYSGPMQVRAAPGESAIAAGTRLTAAATPGQVRALRSFKAQLAEGAGVVDMLETAPVIGVALEAPKDGLVWVLVNPQ